MIEQRHTIPHHCCRSTPIALVVHCGEPTGLATSPATSVSALTKTNSRMSVPAFELWPHKLNRPATSDQTRTGNLRLPVMRYRTRNVPQTRFKLKHIQSPCVS